MERWQVFDGVDWQDTPPPAGVSAIRDQQRHSDPRLPKTGVHEPACRWLCTTPMGTKCEIVHTCWCE